MIVFETGLLTVLLESQISEQIHLLLSEKLYELYLQNNLN